MAKVPKCRSNGGSDKKKGGCSNTRWKGGLCRRCHAAGQEAILRTVPPNKKKERVQKTCGRVMQQEYVHLAHAQVCNKVAKKMRSIRAAALEVYARHVPSPPARPTTRVLFVGKTPEEVAELDALSEKLVNASIR